MARRVFLRYPDRRLMVRVPEIETVDDAIRGIWDEMLEAMYAMPGVGLAANQIGVMQRLAVVDASPSRDAPVRMANPVVLETSAETESRDEGSPNLPGVWAPVTRPRAVRMRFLGEDGDLHERRFEGLWAASVLHQVDHLEGRLFFDRLSPMRRKMLLARALKLSRRGP